MNRGNGFRQCVLVLCALALIQFGCGKRTEKTITIDGSITMMPLLEQIARDYEGIGRVRIRLTSSGSMKGLESLIQGRCTMAAASCKIPLPLAIEAQKKGMTIKEYIIARDMLLPIVHSSNPINNLFLGQLGDMYTGLLKDWKDAEGKAGKITAVDRDDNSGSKMVMYERFFEAKTGDAKNIMKRSDTEVAEYVSQHPRAVGYVSASCRPAGVKKLKINGFQATEENVAKGYYPLCRDLYLYINDKEVDGYITGFVDFMIGPRGQTIVRRTGFVPIPATERATVR